MLALIAVLLASLAGGFAAEMALPRVAKFAGKGTPAYSSQDHALADEIARWARRELRVARMAKTAGASAEVRALAQTLVTYQIRMLSALRELARSHGRALSEAQPAPASGLQAPFAGAKGSAFDRAFREHLRSDPAALQLFSRVAKEARNRDLRRLAESTLGELKSRRPRATALYFAEIEADAQKVASKSKKASQAKKASTQRSKTTAKSRKKAAASETPRKPPVGRTSTTAAVSAEVRAAAPKPKKRAVTKAQKKRTSAARSSTRRYSSAELQSAPRPRVISRPRTRR